MSKWDSLPNEILDKIVNRPKFLDGEDIKDNGWMFVNSKWYTMYQSITYKNVSIDDLNTSNKKLGSIINSKFYSGRWVKSVSFKNFTIPSHYEADIDYATEPLYLLMVHCPNVFQVEFPSRGIGKTGWKYFTHVLKTCNTWKLQVMPTSRSSVISTEDTMEYAGYYSQCAYHLKYSLRSLQVGKGGLMIEKGNYKSLEVFKRLTCLWISGSFLKDFNDFLRLVQFFPDLANVELLGMFFGPTSIKIDKDIYSSIATSNYCKIKTMLFSNYLPTTDEEVLLIMNNFTRLESFTIYGEKKTTTATWPAKITPSVLRSFFIYLYSIKEYKVTLNDCVGDEIRFLQYYSASSNNIEPISLLVDYRWEQEEQDLHIHFTKKEKSSNTYHDVSMSYCLIEPLAQVDNRRVTDFLSNGHQSIQELHLCQGGRVGEGLGSYLDAILLGANWGSLHKLLLSEWWLFIDYTSRTLNMSAAIETPRKNNITNLNFRYGNISDEVLPALSRNFPYLQLLELGACRFVELDEENGVISHKSRFNIFIPNTAVDTLRIASLDENFDKDIHRNLFISLQFLKSNTTIYYSSCYEGEDLITKKVNQDIFESNVNRFSEEEASVICIQVESIKNFVLETEKQLVKLSFS